MKDGKEWRIDRRMLLNGKVTHDYHTIVVDG
jgi:hypothetical protein